ncbi:hypothetical protein, partial [Actinopolyspora erythraea]|uniref:hypothetical protein n=1 Tax=Actinopolyspora erythraea TaxID=414996 RepID=UPI001C0FC888
MSDQSRITTEERSVPCEIPGCLNRMSYAGTGRKPKYCGEIIDGVPHTRLTAHRLSKGEIT